MYLTAEVKKEIFKKYQKHEKDTGTTECQIALLTFRINHLTQHLKINRKDYSTQLGLLKMVGQRKKLLRYLENCDISKYRKLLEDLKIRK